MLPVPLPPPKAAQAGGIAIVVFQFGKYGFLQLCNGIGS